MVGGEWRRRGWDGGVKRQKVAVSGGGRISEMLQCDRQFFFSPKKCSNLTVVVFFPLSSYPSFINTPPPVCVCVCPRSRRGLSGCLAGLRRRFGPVGERSERSSRQEGGVRGITEREGRR